MTANLLDFDQPGLAAFFAELGEKPFRAKQLMRWMHHFGVNDFGQMTDVAKTLREKLAQEATLGDYLRGRASRRFVGTRLRLLVTGFLVSAASNNCRMPCSNSPTALSKAPSCPTRTIATDGRRSNDGGRNIFTVSME